MRQTLNIEVVQKSTFWISYWTNWQSRIIWAALSWDNSSITPRQQHPKVMHFITLESKEIHAIPWQKMYYMIYHYNSRSSRKHCNLFIFHLTPRPREAFTLQKSTDHQAPHTPKFQLPAVKELMYRKSGFYNALQPNFSLQGLSTTIQEPKLLLLEEYRRYSPQMIVRPYYQSCQEKNFNVLIDYNQQLKWYDGDWHETLRTTKNYRMFYDNHVKQTKPITSYTWFCLRLV